MDMLPIITAPDPRLKIKPGPRCGRRQGSAADGRHVGDDVPGDRYRAGGTAGRQSSASSFSMSRVKEKSRSPETANRDSVALPRADDLSARVPLIASIMPTSAPAAIRLRYLDHEDEIARCTPRAPRDLLQHEIEHLDVSFCRPPLAGEA